MSRLRGFLRRLPGIATLDRLLRERYTGFPGGYNAGHFHSPIPAAQEIRARAGHLFRQDVDPGPSLNLREEAQRELLAGLAPFYSEFPWRHGGDSRFRFHTRQQAFRNGDAIALFSLMRMFRPGRICEIGSGFSSAMMLDVNEFFLDRSVRLTFIDPYPGRLQALLKEADRETIRILPMPVQEVPAAEFSDLDPGDFLFVDSSHVAKIGSDVNRILFEILPVLKPGVLVHFHDIFWPFEYPEEWVLEGRAWNEAYLLRAFLQYNEEFRILLFNDWAVWRFRPFFETKIPDFLAGRNGSLWLQKGGN